MLEMYLQIKLYSYYQRKWNFKNKIVAILTDKAVN